MAPAAYHQAELVIASNPEHVAYCLPTLPPNYERILDVGCGHGQTLQALGVPYNKGFGVDLSVPESPYNLSAAKGESLPFPDQHFDFIICRVSLPYMDIPQALREMRRVLKPGGQVWLSLHGLGYLRRRIFKAIRTLDAVDLFYCCYYIVLNSISFAVFGVVTPWTSEMIESVQTPRGIRRALHRAGFRSVSISHAKFFEVNAWADLRT